MPVTEDQLKAIYPYAIKRIPKFLGPLNTAMQRYGIESPTDTAMFLAQIGHESGQLRYVEELASGDAYEGRKDLGNTTPGDGRRFKGRGLIQITGRSNYGAFSQDYYQDSRLWDTPEILAELEPACASAGWFWNKHGLYRYSEDILTCTRRINGGTNGLAERTRLWSLARSIMGLVG
jgi:putative chitinase